jgi:hypothetical protein
MLFPQIIFHAALGLAFGKAGLYDPNGPIPVNPSPVAMSLVSLSAAILSGWLTSFAFGQEQQAVAAIGAGAGAVLATSFAKRLGMFGKAVG